MPLQAACPFTDAKPLQRSIAALKKQCQTSPNHIDASFADVHEAFHRLIE